MSDILSYGSNEPVALTTFTEQDQRVLDSLMRKKQKAEEDERKRKNREIELSKELFGSFNETIRQMQDLIAVHEAQVGDLAVRYKDVMPANMVSPHAKGAVANDGYKEKYDALVREVEDLRKKYAEMESACEEAKAQYNEVNNLIERLFGTMDKRPENFEEFVIWRELKAEERRAQQIKKAEKKNSSPAEPVPAPVKADGNKGTAKENKKEDITDDEDVNILNDEVADDDNNPEVYFNSTNDVMSVEDSAEDDDLIIKFD